MFQESPNRLHETSEQLKMAYRRNPRVVGGVVAAFVTAAVVPLVATIWLTIELRDLSRQLPDKEAVGRIGEMDQATSVLDSADRLAFTIFKEQRIDVPLDQVSPNVKTALLSIEDQRFFQHQGFDPIRIASAALANVRHQRVAQGGSTLTQQLARQSFLAKGKTIRRKVQELILAERIESQYTKGQILEMYLNKVYFGDGLYGIEAASRGYFGKPSSDLTVAEAALLAGLVKSPSTYAPTVSMSRAVSRRGVVLQAMLDGKAIDRATFDEARAAKVTLNDGLRAVEPHGQYFKEQVRLELVERFGWPRVYQGGLRVYTTIDMPMQIAAETAVAESMKALDERRAKLLARRAARKKSAPVADTEPLQAALIALDPRTGHVRAMVGGRDFKNSRFNRAVQAQRQPGSAFKPFVYAAALESGFTPASIINRLDDPIATPQGDYTPDDGHSTASEISLRAGLRISSNRAAVRLLQEVGIARTVQYAKQLGFGNVPSVPSLALGSGEVTLASMTAAYAAFANQGLVPQPILIRRVEDRDGRVLYSAEGSPRRVISEATAFLMSNMLADVINAGTAAGVRRLGFILPAAGKTGTTNDFHDAWFVGYTPKLTAGVWVGFDQPQTILPNGFAADIAVPLWANFMKAATRDDKPEWFKAPRGVTTAAVCRLTGKLATDDCYGAGVYTEYFAANTVPTAYCDGHESPDGFFTRITRVFGAGDRPAPPAPMPPPALSPGLSEAAAVNLPVTVGTAGQGEIPPTVVKKKPGFWSRIFRRGRNADAAEPAAAEKTEDEPALPTEKGGQ